MIHETISDPCFEITADALVIAGGKDQPLSGSAKILDDACNQQISQLIKSNEISTDFLETTRLLGLENIPTKTVLFIGLGEEQNRAAANSFMVAATAAKALADRPRSSIAFYLDIEDLEQSICGAIVGCHGQDLFRNEKDLHPFDRLMWHGATDTQIEQGQILGEAMNLTRRTVNLPANEIYPESFSRECQQVAEQTGLDIEIWDEQKLEQEKCGAFLAVAKGSEKPPRLAILRHNGGGDSAPLIALVGKGVTFDSGGLSLKPSTGMLDMKCDMTGAATVLGTMAAIARLKLPVNVVGLMGLAENMVSGASYKLGDVLTARSGKTIEVHNTDAEGRLVLADVLNVAVGMKPTRIIDFATLTGACVVALGIDTCGVMTNDQDLCDSLLAACESAGEMAWQLPMFPLFNKQIRSKVADIKNVGDGRWGGAITAGKFLEEFVEDVPWVHVDIAGPSFHEKPKPWVDAGASGCMVRSMVRYFQELDQDS